MITVYLIMHVFGIVLVASSLAAMINASRSSEPEQAEGLSRRILMISHGTGMLLILVAGFGLLARNGISFPWPGWVFVKLIVFFVRGAYPTLLRKMEQRTPVWFSGLILSLLIAIIMAFSQPI